MSIARVLVLPKMKSEEQDRIVEYIRAYAAEAVRLEHERLVRAVETMYPEPEHRPASIVDNQSLVHKRAILDILRNES